MKSKMIKQITMKDISIYLINLASLSWMHVLVECNRVKTIHAFPTSDLLVSPDSATPRSIVLKKQLSHDGELDEVKALVLVAAIPLAYLNAQLASQFREAKDHWAFGRYKREQIQLLSLLQQY